MKKNTQQQWLLKPKYTMKKVMSVRKVADFCYHKVDGFICSQEGIDTLLEKKLISIEEYRALVQQNLARLKRSVAEWRIAEQVGCLVFAGLFGWFALTSPGEDMVRRAGRRTRRKNECEYVIEN